MFIMTSLGIDNPEMNSMKNEFMIALSTWLLL